MTIKSLVCFFFVKMSQQKLKLFEEEDAPIQLTVNSAFALQYEKKKRGEELSKRNFVLI